MSGRFTAGYRGRADSDTARAYRYVDNTDTPYADTEHDALARWQMSTELVGVARDHAPWMTVQMQRGRSPLMPKPHIVMLKRIAGMISGKGGVPGVNVVSVTIGRRIVIHQVKVARADSSSQCSEHRQCAECGHHR
jgi:hypothetical protein